MAQFPPEVPLDRPIRLAVLISGGGTTLANLADWRSRGELDAEIPLVIASRPDCGGIAKARDAGISCAVVTRAATGSLEAFSAAIFDRCRAVEADLVVCGGFLALLAIPADFRQRVMNIHPSLLPAFCGQGMHGRHVHEAVLARGCKLSGCTVHFLDDHYDHGPIILQRPVPVLDGDTPESLASRVFAAECRAYPEAIRLYAEGLLRVSGQWVTILPEPESRQIPEA
jgi:formyltetrahydrofolate-dependent phosphoribosylglycinamide formyltransferase